VRWVRVVAMLWHRDRRHDGSEARLVRVAAMTWRHSDVAEAQRQHGGTADRSRGGDVEARQVRVEVAWQ
jgi:hypothetical protein